MYEPLWVRGIVLSVSQLGEYDKRMVVLTEQLGKITIFANGARRQNNRFTAVAQSFTMGRFQLRPGNQAYTLTGAEIERPFLELSGDIEGYTSAAYCCELTDYFTREGVGGSDELNLLYVTFLALLEERLPFSVIRSAFALKLLHIEGEAPEMQEPAIARYILEQPIGRTFSFEVKDQGARELDRVVKKELDRVLDYPLRSEGILASLAALGMGTETSP